MNRLICSGTADGMFVTLLMVIFDPATQTFEYFNAGHPGWIVRKDKREQLTTHQIPLGLLTEVDHSNSSTFQLASGDILVIPTDGIPESPNQHEIFGTSRSLDCIEANRNLQASEIVERLFNAAIEFSDSEVLCDDMTLVVLKAN